MKKKILKDVSASTLQVIINQLLGFITFYVISKYLNKGTFGEINWSLAVWVTTFNILGCGIDQITIKRVASGASEKDLIKVYFGHVLLTGISFYGILLCGSFFFPEFYQNHSFLLLLGISQLLLFFSTPFKQVANSKERFRVLLLMSICSNICKTAGLVVLLLTDHLTTATVIYLFVISAGAEMLVCFLLGKIILQLPLYPGWDKHEYLALLKESLPQLGSVIFNSAVARFDWILLGVLSTAVITAEYSFAYKVFELSTLPLLIIAPLLLPRFTRFFNHQSAEDLYQKKTELVLLVRYEIIIASFVALVLNMVWAPVIDTITNNKYGLVNVSSIFILSCAMSFLYLNNFFWSVNFAQGKLKNIFFIITITVLINITGDIVLIPFYKAEGAAIAFLVAIIVQTGFYAKRTPLLNIGELISNLLTVTALALISGIICRYCFSNTWLQLGVAVFIYTSLLYLCRQVKPADRRQFKNITGL